MDDITSARPPDRSVEAIVQGVASLKSGMVSMVFHAPTDWHSEALKLHSLQGKRVVMDLFVVSDHDG